MLMFYKKNLENPIELRHQRSPDVVFDKIRESNSNGESKPVEAYNAVETLLPTAIINHETLNPGSFKLLELWCAEDKHRDQWIRVIDDQFV